MNSQLMKTVASAITLLVLTCFCIASVVAQTSPSPYTQGKRYNLAGQLTAVISPDPDGGGPRTHAAVRHTYNTKGLLVALETGSLFSWPPHHIEAKDWAAQGYSFTVENIQTFTYDNWGRKLTATTKDHVGNAHRQLQYSYDSLGRLDCEAVRMNPNVYGSPPASACVLGTEGSLGKDRITKYVYDTKDRVTTIQKAVGTPLVQSYARYTYNSFWEKAAVTDANGNKADLRYDGFGRLKRWVFPSKTQVGVVNEADYEEYGYDLNSNRTSLRKRDGQVISYGFDLLNRVTLKDLPGTANDVSYSYDNRGLELAARFSATGTSVVSRYDGFGRIISSTDLLPASRALTYDYDANGNRTRITHPDGHYFVYTYDGGDLLSAVSENSTGATPVLSPIHNTGGQRTAVNLAGGGSTAYTYDALQRLDGISHNLSGTAQDISHSFAYNPANQIIRRSVSNTAYIYSGNQNITGTYTVNGLNQYTGAGGKVFTYDNNSNLTSDGSTTFTYDAENRLISASGAKNATLRYDPKGRLGSITSAGVTTQFLYDGDALVAEYNTANTVLNRYVHGSGVDDPYLWYPGSSVTSTNRRYLHADHQGSIIGISDSNAGVVAINAYDVYGIPKSNHLGRFAYTGQIYLPEVGLYYYKARIYSPTLGRFLQTDPIGYDDNMNLYAYVGNDPVNRVDPTGKYGRGSGFTDAQWKKFDQVQQKAAGKMEKTASNMESKAAKLDTKGKPGGDALRAKAGSLNAGASALRSNGADGKIANAVSKEVYASMPGHTEGGAASVKNNGPVMTVNIGNTNAWGRNAGESSERVVGHESLHTAGLNDQKINGIRAYWDGPKPTRDAFEQMKGTPQADVNPDHLMDEVY